MKPGSRIAHFEVLGLIGAGGMADVYRAHDTRLGRDVAIKVLPAEYAADPERLRRFEQEARAVAALDHPNILAVHNVGTHEGVPYIVSELLEGKTLRDRLHSGGLTVRKAVETAVQIAQGLAAAHEKGVIHRDLKPGNVFLTKDGQVKILDFGLAKLAAPRSAVEAAQASTVVEPTEAGTTLGTVGYMSPEQVRGQSVDQRTDIFSFGCVLHEMLSGRSPFHRDTPAETMAAILHDDAPALAGTGREISPTLQGIVWRCLEKQAEDRFGSARDVAFALEAVGSETSPPAAGPVVAEGWLRRWWLATAIMVIGAVAVVVGLLLTQAAPSGQLPLFHTRQVTGELALEGRAAISPNGNEIVYTTKEDGKSSIWITDIRGGNALRVVSGLPQASDPSWFRDGSTVAFTSGDGATTAIWKVPRFGGTAMPLVPNAEQAALSPDGTRIAFSRRAEEGFLRIWVARLNALDRARQITNTGDGRDDHVSPAWSPDSKTICYADVRGLWLVAAEGRKARRLTSDSWANVQPAWSADGRFVYFASAREGTQALWRIAADGGPHARVTDGTGYERFPSLSADGKRFAFVSRSPNGNIALVNLRTNRVARISEGGYSWLPAIAPDRSALVFVSQFGDAATLRSIHLQDDAPASQSIVLVDQLGAVFSPDISSDGRWLAFYREVEGRREVWVVPAHGGLAANFSGHTGQDVQPVWSPDSRRIAFVSNRGGTYQIWVAPFADGRRTAEPLRVSGNSGTATYPSWSPDGKTIAYLLVTGDSKDVWVTPADGGGPSRRLTFGAQADCLRWFGTSEKLLVSGYWGHQSPAFRLLYPETGETCPFSLPGSLTLDPDVVDFDLSADASLLALFEGRAQGAIWVREAEKGSF